MPEVINRSEYDKDDAKIDAIKNLFNFKILFKTFLRFENKFFITSSIILIFNSGSFIKYIEKNKKLNNENNRKLLFLRTNKHKQKEPRLIINLIIFFFLHFLNFLFNIKYF